MDYGDFKLTDFGASWIAAAVAYAQDSSLPEARIDTCNCGYGDDSAMDTEDDWGQDVSPIVTSEASSIRIVFQVDNSNVSGQAFTGANKITIMGYIGSGSPQCIAYAHSDVTEDIPPYTTREVARRYDVILSASAQASVSHAVTSGIYAPLLGCARTDGDNAAMVVSSLLLGTSARGGCKIGWMGPYGAAYAVMTPDGTLTECASVNAMASAVNAYFGSRHGFLLGGSGTTSVVQALSSNSTLPLNTANYGLLIEIVG